MLLIIPTLLVVSIVVFFLSKVVPQDPVSMILTLRGSEVENKKAYENIYKELKLDRPNFYFSFIPNHYPNNLNSISDSELKEKVKTMVKSSYAWQDFQQKIDANNTISLKDLKNGIKPQSVFYPKLVVHGLDNQYHNWIKSLFSNEVMTSYIDGKSVSSKVGKSLLWTLSITLTDLVINIFLGLWLGVFLFKHRGKLYSKVLKGTLFLLYSLPLFWLATLFVVYLTTDDYGSWTNIFPSVGIDIYPGESTGYQIFNNIPKLILPVLCLTLHSLAYVSKFIQRSIEDEFKKPYVETAYSKGLSNKEVLDNHIFKNALIPSITIFIGALSNAFVGSLLLEVIFNIPGIGRLLFDSIIVADWNVVFYIILVVSLVTSLVYLIGDILYAFVNPKIKYDA